MKGELCFHCFESSVNELLFYRWGDAPGPLLSTILWCSADYFLAVHSIAASLLLRTDERRSDQ